MDDGKLNCVNGKALEYASGAGVYAYKGVRYATLTELTIATMLKEEAKESEE
jgi:hypothetical protein